MNWIDAIGLFIGSLLSNTLASLSGGGAGLLQFPLLIFMGLPFSIALATHKIASVALGLGATMTHYKHGGVPFKMAAYLILVGSIGVVIGAHLVVLIPEDIARKMLGGLILTMGIYSRLKKQLGSSEQPNNRHVRGFLIGSVILIIIGIINGSLAAGSGLLVTLFLVRWFGFSYKQAIALTMISVGFFWNGIGAAAIVIAGAVIYWPWLPILLLGSFLGGSLGAILTKKLSNRVIKIAFEVLTLLVGFKLLV
jgi:uncharacterized membrane protein YfcA